MGSVGGVRRRFSAGKSHCVAHFDLPRSWHGAAEDRQDLAQRQAHPMGRRAHPRDVARRSLRLSVFEGIRCYDLPSGPAIFRANEHMQRLLDSAKVYRMDLPFTRDELVQGMVETRRTQWRVPVLHPPGRAARIRRCRRESAELSGRSLYLQLSVGKISGRRGGWLRRVRFVVDSPALRTPCRPWPRRARIT